MKISPTLKRTAGYAVFDVFFVNLSIYIALSLRFEGAITRVILDRFGTLWPLYSVLCVGVFIALRIYRILWQYADADDYLRLCFGSMLTLAGLYVIDRGLMVMGIGVKTLPRSTFFIGFMIQSLILIASRFMIRVYPRFEKRMFGGKDGEQRRRVLIVGAGTAGSIVVRELSMNGIKPILLVDDNPEKNKTYVLNTPVYSDTNQIPHYVSQFDIHEIIIALPSADNASMQRIVDICTRTDCKLRIVPSLATDGDESSIMRSIREVNISDLLFREEVRLDTESISEYLRDQVVLVTGGGGSIGSELCRQIATFCPKQLIIFDMIENGAYELLRELEQKFPQLTAIVRIGSIREPERLEEIFSEFKPDVVFHAAAHKHVPLMETSPAEAVKNNVFGMMNTIKCADKHGVKRFVMISTDKAVNPTNIMGATKRITELIMQYMSKRTQMRCVAVRFGNVLGSNGSVIPLFKRMIAEGGPVTVMHPDITRYFMTIPEASRLVIQAGGMARTGTIFVLDMGQPINIRQLAENLIRLSGLRPNVDIDIVYTGLRPGEKLYEELIMAEEQEHMQKTQYDRIFVAQPLEIDEASLEQDLEALRLAAQHNDEGVARAIKKIVPNFDHAKNT